MTLSSKTAKIALLEAAFLTATGVTCAQAPVQVEDLTRSPEFQRATMKTADFVSKTAELGAGGLALFITGGLIAEFRKKPENGDERSVV